MSNQSGQKDYRRVARAFWPRSLVLMDLANGLPAPGSGKGQDGSLLILFHWSLPGPGSRAASSPEILADFQPQSRLVD